MSRYLLDTNVLLWLYTEPERIRPEVLALLADEQHELVVSVATPWEIVIKHGRGRLPLRHGPAIDVPRILAAVGATSVAIELAHVLGVAALPHHHGDPFDRLLVAQAQVLGVPIVTGDRQLERYDVDVIAA